MKVLFCLALGIGMVASGTISGYPQPDGGSSGGGYGGGYEKPKCRVVYDSVQEDRCEPYTERVCQTTQRESCQDVADQNCGAIVTTKQIRKCFDVNENICTLKEDIKFDTIQVGFTVQKCRKVKERVCDTVFETQQTTKEDVQCLEIENPSCHNEERIVTDKTCRTTTKFDCKQTGGGGGYGGSGGSGSLDEFGSGGSDGGYGSGSGSSGSGYGGSSGGGGYGGQEEEAPQVVCHRRQETKCYDTPRTVNVQICTKKAEKASQLFVHELLVY
eukprot:maker-scaffold237_size242172-snap-gene-0.20 protein:Tk05166 transcript:maker-scaffold237_size242172-snap-gene-0.20-mRNA-1 annotation:"hypothetical protein"